MFRDLDPLLHSQLRLAIISILSQVESADFSYIKEKTGASSGNLSVQLQKLKEANYIEIHKRFQGSYPQTICKITSTGQAAFVAYVDTLKEYLPKN